MFSMYDRVPFGHMPALPESSRLAWFTRAVAVAFLAAIAMSGSLWLSNRLYPLVPVAGIVPAFPAWLGYGAFGLLAALLLWLVVRPRSRCALYAVLPLIALLFLQDLNRIWPSFYEFSFFLFVIALARAGRNEGRALTVSRFILAAVYFWSGFLKFTPHFYYEVFPWFFAPITAHAPSFAAYLPPLAVAAAAAEVLFALALLTKRFRKFGIFEATAMHLLIFVLIGPLRGNWNDSAWLWSCATVTFLWILFYRAPAFSWREMLFPLTGKERVAALGAWTALLFIGILPALNLVNAWDSALSFNVYTDNIARPQYRVTDAMVSALPAELRRFVQRTASGRAYFNVDAWSAHDFNANTVAAKPVYQAVLARLCRYAPEPGDVTLTYQEKAGWRIPSATTQYSCPR